MSNGSPSAYLLWAILSSIYLVFLLMHLWHYDRFACLRWDAGRQPGAFKRVMTYSYLATVPLLVVFSVAITVFKFKEGFMVLPDGMITPVPFSLWGTPHRHWVLPLYFILSVAWSLEHVTHLEELTFWMFLLAQGPEKREWFTSWEFRVWTLGSICSVAGMPTTVLATRYNIDICLAYIFLVGSAVGTTTTLCFLYVLARFPSFILHVKAEGAEPDVVVRLATFYQLNRIRVIFRFLFTLPLMILGIDALNTGGRVILNDPFAADFLLMMGAIGCTISSAITLLVFFPRSITNESGYKTKAPTHTHSHDSYLSQYHSQTYPHSYPVEFPMNEQTQHYHRAKILNGHDEEYYVYTPEGEHGGEESSAVSPTSWEGGYDPELDLNHQSVRTATTKSKGPGGGRLAGEESEGEGGRRMSSDVGSGWRKTESEVNSGSVFSDGATGGRRESTLLVAPPPTVASSDDSAWERGGGGPQSQHMGWGRQTQGRGSPELKIRLSSEGRRPSLTGAPAGLEQRLSWNGSQASGHDRVGTSQQTHPPPQLSPVQPRLHTSHSPSTAPHTLLPQTSQTPLIQPQSQSQSQTQLQTQTQAPTQQTSLVQIPTGRPGIPSTKRRRRHSGDGGRLARPGPGGEGAIREESGNEAGASDSEVLNRILERRKERERERARKRGRGRQVGEESGLHPYLLHWTSPLDLHDGVHRGREWIERERARAVERERQAPV